MKKVIQKFGQFKKSTFLLNYTLMQICYYIILHLRRFILSLSIVLNSFWLVVYRHCSYTRLERLQIGLNQIKKKISDS